MFRTTKIIAAFIIGAIGLLFCLDNALSIDAAHAAVSYVVTGTDQPYYALMGPAVTAGWLTWVALFTIMGMELLVGVLGFTGAFRMLRNRGGSAQEFNAAKSTAILAGVTGMLFWYGFFIVIGESYFNMWQTELGTGSVEGAFRYGSVCAVLMFYIASKNE